MEPTTAPFENLRVRGAGLVAACVLSAAAGAADSAPQPQFDVASVKPGGDLFSVRPTITRGRIAWTTQLCYLIGFAYDVDFSTITGRRCDAVYALEATFDPASSEDQVRAMIQALLVDRFQFRAHRVTTESDGYAMVVAKGGAKMQQAREGEEPPPLPEWVKDKSGGVAPDSYISAWGLGAGVIAVTGRKVSMTRLAQHLQRLLDTPVWNRTGLTGDFYFAFRYAQFLKADFDTDFPPLPSALQESLGLKLEKQRGPAETIMIDSMVLPTDN